MTGGFTKIAALSEGQNGDNYYLTWEMNTKM